MADATSNKSHFQAGRYVDELMELRGAKTLHVLHRLARYLIYELRTNKNATTLLTACCWERNQIRIRPDNVLYILRNSWIRLNPEIFDPVHPN